MKGSTYSIKETYQSLGICRTYAYKLIQQGKFPGVIRIGERIRISKVVIDKLLRQVEAETFNELRNYLTHKRTMMLLKIAKTEKLKQLDRTLET